MTALDDACLLAARHAALSLPAVKSDPARFARDLAGRTQTPADLVALNVEDLYLAWACLEGDAAALGELDRRLLRCVRGVTSQLQSHERAEVEQLVRHRVLVGDRKGGARLAKYGGRGALAAWLKVVAASIAIDESRRDRPERRASDDALLATASAEAGPETRLGDAQHRHHFNAAFKLALACLTPQQRTLMRMRFVDGLDIEEVGKCFAVHRTTAMRWLEKAQEQVLEQTRAQLAQRLGLNSRELASLMRALKPSMNERISRVLSSDASRTGQQPDQRPGGERAGRNSRGK